MKKQEVAKLKNKSAAELTKDVAEAKEKLWQLRREIEGGKVKNVHAKAELRRDIARMITVAEEKQKTRI